MEKIDIDKLNEAIRVIGYYCRGKLCPSCLFYEHYEAQQTDLCSLFVNPPCSWLPVTGKD